MSVRFLDEAVTLKGVGAILGVHNKLKKGQHDRTI